jgi:hypothetical protein
MRNASKWAVLVLAPLIALGGCKRGISRGFSNIAALTDALAYGDTDARASAVAGAPKCPPDAKGPQPGCLSEIMAWYGSKGGFHPEAPEQATGAAVALVIARDGHGEWIPASDPWLVALRAGNGEGADALRFAVATRMADGIESVARPLASDDDARALMRFVATAVPGACETYARLGAGEPADAPPPQGTADHSPCVQKDLDRSTGPDERGRYGYGLWRGVEGAMAVLRAAADALHDGTPKVDARVRAAFEKRVAQATAALAKVETKKLPPATDYARTMGDVHGDAGISFPQTKR